MPVLNLLCLSVLFVCSRADIASQHAPTEPTVPAVPDVKPPQSPNDFENSMYIISSNLSGLPELTTLEVLATTLPNKIDIETERQESVNDKSTPTVNSNPFINPVDADEIGKYSNEKESNEGHTNNHFQSASLSSYADNSGYDEEAATKELTDGFESNDVINDLAASGNVVINAEQGTETPLTNTVPSFENDINCTVKVESWNEGEQTTTGPSAMVMSDQESLFNETDVDSDESIFESNDPTEENLFGVKFEDIPTMTTVPNESEEMPLTDLASHLSKFNTEPSISEPTNVENIINADSTSFILDVVEDSSTEMPLDSATFLNDENVDSIENNDEETLVPDSSYETNLETRTIVIDIDNSKFVIPLAHSGYVEFPERTTNTQVSAGTFETNHATQNYVEEGTTNRPDISAENIAPNDEESILGEGINTTNKPEPVSDSNEYIYTTTMNINSDEVENTEDTTDNNRHNKEAQSEENENNPTNFFEENAEVNNYNNGRLSIDQMNKEDGEIATDNSDVVTVEYNGASTESTDEVDEGEKEEVDSEDSIKIEVTNKDITTDNIDVVESYQEDITEHFEERVLNLDQTVKKEAQENESDVTAEYETNDFRDDLTSQQDLAEILFEITSTESAATSEYGIQASSATTTLQAIRDAEVPEEFIDDNTTERQKFVTDNTFNNNDETTPEILFKNNEEVESFSGNPLTDVALQENIDVVVPKEFSTDRVPEIFPTIGDQVTIKDVMDVIGSVFKELEILASEEIVTEGTSKNNYETTQIISSTEVFRTDTNSTNNVNVVSKESLSEDKFLVKNFSDYDSYIENDELTIDDVLSTTEEPTETESPSNEDLADVIQEIIDIVVPKQFPTEEVPKIFPTIENQVLVRNGTKTELTDSEEFVTKFNNNFETIQIMPSSKNVSVVVDLSNNVDVVVPKMFPSEKDDKVLETNFDDTDSASKDLESISSDELSSPFSDNDEIAGIDSSNNDSSTDSTVQETFDTVLLKEFPIEEVPKTFPTIEDKVLIRNATTVPAPKEFPTEKAPEIFPSIQDKVLVRNTTEFLSDPIPEIYPTMHAKTSAREDTDIGIPKEFPAEKIPDVFPTIRGKALVKSATESFGAAVSTESVPDIFPMIQEKALVRNASENFDAVVPEEFSTEEFPEIFPTIQGEALVRNATENYDTVFPVKFATDQIPEMLPTVQDKVLLDDATGDAIVPKEFSTDISPSKEFPTGAVPEIFPTIQGESLVRNTTASYGSTFPTEFPTDQIPEIFRTVQEKVIFPTIPDEVILKDATESTDIALPKEFPTQTVPEIFPTIQGESLVRNTTASYDSTFPTEFPTYQIPEIFRTVQEKVIFPTIPDEVILKDATDSVDIAVPKEFPTGTVPDIFPTFQKKDLVRNASEDVDAVILKESTTEIIPDIFPIIQEKALAKNNSGGFDIVVPTESPTDQIPEVFRTVQEKVLLNKATEDIDIMVPKEFPTEAIPEKFPTIPDELILKGATESIDVVPKEFATGTVPDTFPIFQEVRNASEDFDAVVPKEFPTGTPPDIFPMIQAKALVRNTSEGFVTVVPKEFSTEIVPDVFPTIQNKTLVRNTSEGFDTVVPKKFPIEEVSQLYQFFRNITETIDTVDPTEFLTKNIPKLFPTAHGNVLVTNATESVDVVAPIEFSMGRIPEIFPTIKDKVLDTTEKVAMIPREFPTKKTSEIVSTIQDMVLIRNASESFDVVSNEFTTEEIFRAPQDVLTTAATDSADIVASTQFTPDEVLKIFPLVIGNATETVDIVVPQEFPTEKVPEIFSPIEDEVLIRNKTENLDIAVFEELPIDQIPTSFPSIQEKLLVSNTTEGSSPVVVLQEFTTEEVPEQEKVSGEITTESFGIVIPEEFPVYKISTIFSTLQDLVQFDKTTERDDTVVSTEDTFPATEDDTNRKVTGNKNSNMTKLIEKEGLVVEQNTKIVSSGDEFTAELGESEIKQSSQVTSLSENPSSATLPKENASSFSSNTEKTQSLLNYSLNDVQPLNSDILKEFSKEFPLKGNEIYYEINRDISASNIATDDEIFSEVDVSGEEIGELAESSDENRTLPSNNSKSITENTNSGIIDQKQNGTLLKSIQGPTTFTKGIIEDSEVTVKAANDSAIITENYTANSQENFYTDLINNSESESEEIGNEEGGLVFRMGGSQGQEFPEESTVEETIDEDADEDSNEYAMTVVEEYHEIVSDDDYVPYIQGRVFGQNANFSVKIVVENTTFYIPPYAYLQETKDDPSLNITWGSSNNLLNNSLAFALTQTSNYYVINGVQLNVVQDNELVVWKENVMTVPKQTDKLEGHPYEIKFEDAMQVFISNIDFLYTPSQQLDNNTIDPDAKSSESSRLRDLRIYHIEVALGSIGVVAVITAILYLVISQARERALMEKDKPSQHVAV